MQVCSNYAAKNDIGFQTQRFGSSHIGRSANNVSKVVLLVHGRFAVDMAAIFLWFIIHLRCSNSYDLRRGLPLGNVSDHCAISSVISVS